MPEVCSVDNCTSKHDSGVAFFKCPKNEFRCKEWKSNLKFTGEHKYADMPPGQFYEVVRICGLHFTDDSFTDTTRQHLVQDAIPTLLLAESNEETTNNLEIIKDEEETGKICVEIENHDSDVEIVSSDLKDSSMNVDENFEEYVEKLKNIDANLTNLKVQKSKIEYEIQILKEQKKELQNEYNLAKIRKRADTSQWVKKNFSWSEKLTEVLKKKFGFDDFRSKQLAAINATLSNKDVLLVMPTGGGKSLIYQLPALIDKHLTLVISPLISLIEDQLMALKKIGIGAATINASSTKEEKKFVHTEMLSDHTKINLLYCTPEWVAKSKLFMTYLQKCFDKKYLKRIVIDEVHCCSTWGHDFRPEYNHLGFFKSMFPGIPILGLTATATMGVLIDCQNMLGLQDTVVITAPFNRPNLYYKIVNKPPDKTDCLDMLEKLLKYKYKDQSGIIYTSTIKECEELAEGLSHRGLRVKYYHAQLESSPKKIIHERWISNKYQAIVATIAFGMGIDKPDVRFVIHYAIPKSMESFYQESGRAGRDGQISDCILMFSLSDFLRNVSMASSKTEEKNAKSILEYSLDQNSCRRALIAKFFEDKFEPTDCNKMCDHCKNPKDLSYYNITPALVDITKLIEVASQKETKLTLNKLIGAWFQTGSKELRVPSMKKPTCTKVQAEHIIGMLIFKGYLTIDKGYTMYTTLAYIQKGSIPENCKVIVPYASNLGYRKVSNDLENRETEEPAVKKVKR